MDKELALNLIKLLSALESWGFSSDRRFPDWLHEDLCNLVEVLSKEVLK